MKSILMKSVGNYYYCAAVAMFSYCMATAAETNDSLDWFVVPGLVWGDETNGFRVGITCGDPGGKGIMAFVARTETNSTNQSRAYNSYTRYLAPPGVKFVKVELRDTNAVVVAPLRGKTLDGILPKEIPTKDLPRNPVKGTNERGSGGGLRDWLVGNPSTLQVFSIQDYYRIAKEGDYMLTVCPVIYKFETNTEYVYRVDLPCVTTKIHLKPPD